MKKRLWIKAGAALALAAALLAGTAKLPGAMAYFTSYVAASGGHPVTLGNSTEIEEEVTDMAKHITVANTGETDCYVRVKVFGGSQFALDISGDSRWTQGEDGYWYYSEILAPGESSLELVAAVTVPQDHTEAFNIIVVSECTPALYEADGTPYGDWERTADTVTDIGAARTEGGENP